MKTDDDKNLGDAIPTKFPAELEAMIRDLEAHSGLPRSTVIRRCVRFAMDEVQRRGDADWLLYDEKKPIGFLAKAVVKENASSYKAKPKNSPKRKVSHLTDKAWVSLSIFGAIPAGWPAEGSARKAKRTVKVPRGKYPSDAFGLDVTGDSMNAAKGRLGPILPGETVVLVPFECGDRAAGKIVAALIDGKTTLKRMVCPKDADCYLQPESTNPEFAGRMRPLEEVTVQGVVVGKL